MVPSDSRGQGSPVSFPRASPDTRTHPTGRVCGEERAPAGLLPAPGTVQLLSKGLRNGHMGEWACDRLGQLEVTVVTLLSSHLGAVGPLRVLWGLFSTGRGGGGPSQGAGRASVTNSPKGERGAGAGRGCVRPPQQGNGTLAGWDSSSEPCLSASETPAWSLVSWAPGLRALPQTPVL